MEGRRHCRVLGQARWRESERPSEVGTTKAGRPDGRTDGSPAIEATAKRKKGGTNQLSFVAGSQAAAGS